LAKKSAFFLLKISAQEKRHFFCQKLEQIAEISDHNINTKNVSGKNTIKVLFNEFKTLQKDQRNDSMFT
jgi:hypothetical protein